jgi:hypothetical protein
LAIADSSRERSATGTREWFSVSVFSTEYARASASLRASIS